MLVLGPYQHTFRGYIGHFRLEIMIKRRRKGISRVLEQEYSHVYLKPAAGARAVEIRENPGRRRHCSIILLVAEAEAMLGSSRELQQRSHPRDNQASLISNHEHFSKI